MKRYFFLLSILISSSSFAVQGSDSDKIVGLWKSPGQEVMIKVDRVGNHYQGRIVWLSSDEGKPLKLDENNPDEHLRKLPLKGNKIIQDLSFNQASSSWEGGIFYQFEEGKMYKCQISLKNANQIEIKRYTQNQSQGVVETWTKQ